MDSHGDTETDDFALAIAENKVRLRFAGELGLGERFFGCRFGDVECEICIDFDFF